MRYLIILIFLVSCGDHSTSNRCFTQEEAVSYCMVNELKEGLITEEQARINCGAKYPAKDFCYYL